MRHPKQPSPLDAAAHDTFVEPAASIIADAGAEVYPDHRAGKWVSLLRIFSDSPSRRIASRRPAAGAA
jgi:hypothetical protein